MTSLSRPPSGPVAARVLDELVGIARARGRACGHGATGRARRPRTWRPLPHPVPSPRSRHALGDDARDVGAPAAFEPFGRFLAVFAIRAPAIAWMSFVFAVMSYSLEEGIAPVLSPTLSEPLPEHPPTARLDSGDHQAPGRRAWRAGTPGRRGKRKASSQLPGSRACVDVKAPAYSMRVVPGGCRLGTLFEAEDVAGSGGRGHGRLQSGSGEMRSARASIAPTRLSEATRLPRTLRPPPSRRRGVHPEGMAGRPARVPPKRPHRALLRADPLVIRTLASCGEPGEAARFILKCFDDRSAATCARVGTGRLPVSLRGRQRRDATGMRGPSECKWKQ